MTLRHPDRPRPGTPAHRAWVLTRIREAAASLEPGQELSRDGLVEFHGGLVTKNDIAVLRKPWKTIRAEALASTPVDVSGLDFDDDATQPGGPAFEVAVPPREATPRELIEAQRAKAEAASLRRKLDETVRELRDADERAGVVDALRSAPEPSPIIRREKASGLREATPVVMCSDWHVEEVVDPRAIEGRNAYSPEITRARVERLARAILWMIEMHRGRFAIRDLVLWIGGDIISGYLHEELEETNALSPIEATLFAYELLAGVIVTLLDRGDLERIIVPCNVGNHGRTTRKIRAKTRIANSYEYLLYRQLEQRFADDPRVEFTIAGGSHLYLGVYDQTIRFLHGDDVRYWGGVGGITIPINKAIAAWQSFRQADLTCLGHFHQLLHGRDFVVNGSLVGYSEFALSVKAQWEPPQQAFFLMDSRRGRCCASPLWVDDEPDRRAA